MNACLRNEVKKIIHTIEELHEFSNNEDERDAALNAITAACAEESFTDHRYTDTTKKK